MQLILPNFVDIIIWDATIYDRITTGVHDCPICNNYTNIKKFHEAHPELLEFWDYEKNTIEPSKIKEYSNEDVYWKCKEGHSFQRPVYRLSQKGFYCPICECYSLYKGINDLKTKFPELAAEWGEKNELPPEEYLPNSNKCVWWKCPNGHAEYFRPIQSRTENNRGCPICMKSIVVEGINDAKSHYPELEAIWDVEANGRGPESVHYESNAQLHFRCKLGHSWIEGLQTSIGNNFTCVYCDNRRPLRGFNTLADLYPDLAAQWDYSSPYNLRNSPETITTTQKVTYSWICDECGNTYLSSIPDNVSGKNGCLYCAGRRVDPEKTSFKALYPILSKEYSAKNTRSADEISPTSRLRVLWDCTECKQEWWSSVRARVKGNVTCPFCNGTKAIPGKTSLKAQYPELMSEWDELSNALFINADEIIPRSSEYAWWICKTCNRRYKTRIKSKVRDLKRSRNSCTFCKGYRRIKHYFI